MVAIVRAALPSDYTVTHAASAADADAVLADVDAILDASMAIPFRADRLARASKLRVYVTATTGADHVDAGELERREIPLITLRGQQEFLRTITAAAEHSWLLLLAVARDLPAAIDQVRSGGWDRTRHPGVMLFGKTLGVVGCGRIGQWMATYGNAFGMRCIGYDPALETFPPLIEPTDLDTLLGAADVVTVHVPLEPSTRGLIGRRELALMRPTAILVNTSRGEIVDEVALVEALTEGRLAGAGLDVVSGEPDVAGHPLLELARHHPRVVVTPHIGGFSPDALGRVLTFSCGRLVEALDRSA